MAIAGNGSGCATAAGRPYCAARHRILSVGSPESEIQSSPDNREPLALIEPQRSAIGLVDVEFDCVRRPALRLGEERAGKAGSPLRWRDAKLIEIAGLQVDGGEAGRPPAPVQPDHDVRASRAERAQTIDKPVAAGGKINVNSGLAPSHDPEVGKRGKIGLGECPERVGAAAHRSRQLEFDAPVAGARLFVIPLVDRLEFAETSRGQAVGLHPLADQILHHRDGARG